jgi:hypothetical protein
MPGDPTQDTHTSIPATSSTNDRPPDRIAGDPTLEDPPVGYGARSGLTSGIACQEFGRPEETQSSRKHLLNHTVSWSKSGWGAAAIGGSQTLPPLFLVLEQMWTNLCFAAFRGALGVRDVTSFPGRPPPLPDSQRMVRFRQTHHTQS